MGQYIPPHFPDVRSFRDNLFSMPGNNLVACSVELEYLSQLNRTGFEFKDLTPTQLKQDMRRPILIDARKGLNAILP